MPLICAIHHKILVNTRVEIILVAVVRQPGIQQDAILFVISLQSLFLMAVLMLGVLKPGGSMFLTAPFRSLYHQTPYYFYSGFSRYWYYHFAQLHGLCIQSLEPNGSYFSDIAQELDRILKIIHPFQIILLSPLIFLLIVYLFLLEYLIRVEAPESCWGYHVVLVKLV